MIANRNKDCKGEKEDMIMTCLYFFKKKENSMELDVGNLPPSIRSLFRRLSYYDAEYKRFWGRTIKYRQKEPQRRKNL